MDKIRVTVWTRWDTSNISPEFPEGGRPKCIFNGDISEGMIPHKGEKICVREGFALLDVDDVYRDFVENSVEIHVNCSDQNNEYGPCLLRLNKK